MSNKYQVVLALSCLWAISLGFGIAEKDKQLAAHHFTRCHCYLIGIAVVLSQP